MSFLNDIWHAIQMLSGSFDLYLWIIAVVAALAAGFAMNSLGQVLTHTFFALIAFAALSFGKSVLIDGKNASAHLDTSWQQFVHLPMLTLIAYAVILGVAVAIVGTIRSVVLR
jgi:hypothetical protein